MEKGREQLLEFVEESLHELRLFNQKLNTSVQRLGQSVKSKNIGTQEPLNCNHIHADEIRSQVQNINNLIKLSTIRMDFIDYEMNPDYFSELPPYQVDMYGKFESSRIALDKLSKDHKVKVIFKNEMRDKTFISAIRLIDILPFLLLDNAIKYSPNGSEVEVEFIRYNTSLEIIVTSVGPYVPYDEIKRLCKKHYRGKNTRDLESIKGQGIGLYFADKIVKLHDARMTLSSSEKIFTMNEIKYSEFQVLLKFPI
ncbi:sensor histidine kinase [Photobacterium damselae]|uniref:sensor histidine kinase n=1 Tax=Photobacterium damselae TaxID=38293 RepID=UPI0040692C7D